MKKELEEMKSLLVQVFMSYSEAFNIVDKKLSKIINELEEQEKLKHHETN